MNKETGVNSNRLPKKYFFNFYLKTGNIKLKKN